MELPWGACKSWDVCLLKALLAEFIGTGIFLFVSLASVIPWTQPSAEPWHLGSTAQSHYSGSISDQSSIEYAAPPEAVVTTAVTNMGHVAMPASHSLAFPDPLFGSLVFGISVALMSYCTWPLSGGHLNPAVTLSMLVAMKVRPSWALCYILAQLLGAITTSALLYGLTPEHSLGEMGINKLAPGVTSLQALAIEMIVSFQYILCILSTSENRRDPSKCGHLIIGLSVTLGHLVAIGYTGCGMNPARSLGPALITFVFTNHWVFWVGPLAGGLAAAILNEWVLFPKCSGFRQWLTMLQEKLQEDRNSQATAENAAQETGLNATP